MSPRKVTAAAVAKLADVSKWTVIRAFDPDHAQMGQWDKSLKLRLHGLNYHRLVKTRD